MSLEHRTTDELLAIVKAGAGLKLGAAGRSTDDLVALADAAADWGTLLTLTGVADRSVGDLVRIAEAGQGSVVFEG